MMQFDQSFDWLLGLLGALWLIGLLLDLRFRISNMRLLRLFFWTLAIGTIALYYLKPFSYEDKSTRKGVLAVTESVVPDSLMDFTPISSKAELINETYTEVVLIDTLLEPWLLERLRAKSIVINHAPIKGLLDFQLPVKNIVGQPVKIQLTSHFESATTLHLVQSNQLLDSIDIESGLLTSTVKFTPNVPGNFTYDILAISEKDTISKQTIPLSITSGEKPGILILQSNPNFEGRFIKNYLGDYGYQVSSRTRISKDLSNKEFINTSRKNIKRLTNRTLTPFRLIILDRLAYDQLGYSEKQAILSKNKSGNLGVLLINTESLEMKGLWTQNYNSQSTEISISGNNLSSHFINSKAVLPIQFGNEILGYYQTNGIGRIGLLTIDNLYQLALEGNQLAYESIIEKTISELLPFERTGEFVQFADVIVRNEKNTVRFTSKSDTPQIRINDIQHPARESAYRPNLFEASFWPGKSGWNQLTIAPDSVIQNFFVFEPNSWKAKRSHELLQHHKHYAATFESLETSIKIQEKKYWNEWLFLIVFLGSMAFLWAEQRFINS